jgi:tetratricopeptide (TPR) repeat protein
MKDVQDMVKNDDSGVVLSKKEWGALMRQQHSALAGSRVFKRAKDWDKAIALTTRLLQGVPDEKTRSTAKWYLGILYTQRGNTFCKAEKWAKAAADFDEAVRLDSSDAAYLYNHGFAYDCSGENGKAMDDYLKAMEIGNEYAMNM